MTLLTNDHPRPPQLINDYQGWQVAADSFTDSNGVRSKNERPGRPARQLIEPDTISIINTAVISTANNFPDFHLGPHALISRAIKAPRYPAPGQNKARQAKPRRSMSVHVNDPPNHAQARHGTSGQ